MRRNTLQRSAVLEVFEQEDRPLSPQEVLEAASRRAPGIGIATVYRALKLLVKEEVLKLVELPGESPHYEKKAQPHHHHFFCTACNRVFPIYTCPGNLEELSPPGFETVTHEIILYGWCADCAPEGEESRQGGNGS